MRFQASESVDGGVCVARGYGLKILVNRGHLVVEDGVGRDRRTRRYSRVTGGLSRLVVIGHTGFVTLDALRWLADCGAGLLHIDEDGQLLTTSALPGPDLAALRRAQALTVASDVGIEITRSVLTAKVAGQQALLDALPGGPTAAPIVERALSTIERAGDLQGIVLAEAQAADAYWDAWSQLALPFTAADEAQVPEHWLRFGQRRSLISKRARLATNPGGAMLNYLYALLEGETILACHAVGLDPGMGIVHSDRRSRSSFALDLMEAARPLVDRSVVERFTRTVLASGDFIETRQGACRLKPPFAAELAGVLPDMRRPVAQIVEQVAHTLASSTSARVPLLTPLTRSNYHAAWRKRRQSNREATPTTRQCSECGAPLPAGGRGRFCGDCRDLQLQSHAAAQRERARETLAQLRAEGFDPAHGGAAGKARAQKNSAHQLAAGRWTGSMPDPAEFASEILPGLRAFTVGQLAVATGLSEAYCSRIRRGVMVPHPRHWSAFRSIL